MGFSCALCTLNKSEGRIDEGQELLDDAAPIYRLVNPLSWACKTLITVQLCMAFLGHAHV